MTVLVLAVFFHGWCVVDSVVCVGTVTDSSKNNIPVKGMRVCVQNVNGVSIAPIVECRTDSLGNYKIVYSGDYTYLHVSTSYWYAYQYTNYVYYIDSTSSSVNRSDGKADTLTLNIQVGSVTPPPDTLVVSGSVLVNPSKAPIKNATVKFVVYNPFILYPLTTLATTNDTLSTTTGDDGSYVFREVNVYAVKSGTIIASCDSCVAASGKGASMADTSVIIFDGTTDSIICGVFYLKMTNATRILPAVAQIAGNSGIASVALYSLDGRLLKKIEQVSIRNIDKAVLAHKLSNYGVILAVWSQNGTTYSKKISVLNIRK